MDEAELTGMPPSASAIGDLVCETEIIGGSLVLTARLSSVFFYLLFTPEAYSGLSTVKADSRVAGGEIECG